MWEKVDPMEVAHIDAFRRDPDRFWHFYAQRFMSLRDKQPNGAHAIVAELERRGLVRAVITQNIDRLHRAAGTRRPDRGPRLDLALGCLECGGRFALDKVVAQLESDPESAPECDCGQPLKPDVVLFGEFLPRTR